MLYAPKTIILPGQTIPVVGREIPRKAFMDITLTPTNEWIITNHTQHPVTVRSTSGIQYEPLSEPPASPH